MPPYSAETCLQPFSAQGLVSSQRVVTPLPSPRSRHLLNVQQAPGDRAALLISASLCTQLEMVIIVDHGLQSGLVVDWTCC